MPRPGPSYATTPRSNPKRPQWATLLDADLSPAFVDDLFATFGDYQLVNHRPPRPGIRYFAHADLSVSQAGFGFALGHAEDIDGDRHTMFDLLGAWDPATFPDHRIDYDFIEDEIFAIAVAYDLCELSFDQCQSTGMIQRLQKRLREAGHKTRVYEARELHGNNWTNAEAFKTALGQRQVHAPRHSLAEAELRSLKMTGLQRVGAPRSGPVTTSDIADSMIAVVAMLADSTKASEIFERFSRLRPVPGSLPQGFGDDRGSRNRPGSRPPKR